MEDWNGVCEELSEKLSAEMEKTLKLRAALTMVMEAFEAGDLEHNYMDEQHRLVAVGKAALEMTR